MEDAKEKAVEAEEKVDLKPEKEDVKEDVKEAAKEDKKPEEKKIEISKFDDIFITEDDTFDITLKYYKKDGQIYTDGGTDDDFSTEVPCKELVVTFKYPDQSDCAVITSATPRMDQDMEKVDVRDFIAMELTRLIILARKWSAPEKINRDSIMKLNTKIVKGLLTKIRNKIGMEGII